MDMQRFLTDQGFDFGYETFANEVERFSHEMAYGLAGSDSSLKMIPAYLSMTDEPVVNETVIAIDMGGTNLRIAKVALNEKGNAHVLQRIHYTMPGTQGEMNRDPFFLTVANYLKEFMDASYPIGLCFSFPCEILPDLDGKILHFNKEVRVGDAAGAKLGNCLNDALAKLGVPLAKRVVVINDTVATLLGARATHVRQRYESYIGLILGTGTNSCYAEKNVAITKNGHLRSHSGSSLVNLESGGYAGASMTACDKRFDAGTDAPNTQLFEKMISGAYIGGLFLTYLRAAVAENIFSPAFSEKIAEIDQLASSEVSKVLVHGGKDGLLTTYAEDESDLQALHALAVAFFRRSGKMVAVNLTAIMKKAGIGSIAASPVCISAEGSTFYNCTPLHHEIHWFMSEYANKKMGLHYKFVHAEDSTIIGSAFAATLANP